MQNDIYKEISNPLTDDVLITLINNYNNCNYDKEFYKTLVSNNNKNPSNQINLGGVNMFHAVLFNAWKNNVINMTRDEFIRLKSYGYIDDDFSDMRAYLKQVCGNNNIYNIEKINKIVYDSNRNFVINNAFEKYYWDSFGKYSGWIHINSRYVDAKKTYSINVEHRLYLNADSAIIHKLAAIFVDKCRNRNIPYYFKFVPSNRDDSFVIYSDSKNLNNYIEIVREIKQEYEDINKNIKKPPILTGIIDDNIGYGSEPLPKNGQNRSYNGIRVDIIINSIIKSFASWALKNQNTAILYNNKYVTLKEYIAMSVADNLNNSLIETYNKKIKTQTDEEFALQHGFKKYDLDSSNIYNFVYNLIKSRTEHNLTELALNGRLDDIRFTGVNDKTISINSNYIKKSLTAAAPSILKQDSTFLEQFRTMITKEASINGIDPLKFCFDKHTIQNMQQINTNNYELNYMFNNNNNNNTDDYSERKQTL